MLLAKPCCGPSLPMQVRAVASNKAAHVKACDALRGALQLFDFEDQSIADLKRMLLLACMSPGFLHRPEGRRFLGGLLTVHPSMVREVTAVMRNQVRVCVCASMSRSALGDRSVLLHWLPRLVPAKQRRSEDLSSGFLGALAAALVPVEQCRGIGKGWCCVWCCHVCCEWQCGLQLRTAHHAQQSPATPLTSKPRQLRAHQTAPAPLPPIPSAPCAVSTHATQLLRKLSSLPAQRPPLCSAPSCRQHQPPAT